MTLKDFLKVCQSSEIIELINSDTGVKFLTHEAHVIDDGVLFDEDMLNKRVVCVRPAVEFNNERLTASTYLRVYFEL